MLNNSGVKVAGKIGETTHVRLKDVINNDIKVIHEHSHNETIVIMIR